MVSTEQVIKLILKKFPNFQKTWQNHLDWWGNEKAGFCNDLGVFSDYVIELLQDNKDKQQLEQVFTFVEELIKLGTPEVQEAIATCFLESIINATSWKTISPLTFVHLLGEESKKYCKAWDEFTGVKTKGLWEEDK